MLTVRPSIGWQPPLLLIDATEPLGEIGLKKSLALARDCAAEARQKAHENIAALAREGDRLRDIHLGVSIIDETVAKAWPPLKEVNVGLMPRSPVKITPAGGARPEAWFEAMA